MNGVTCQKTAALCHLCLHLKAAVYAVFSSFIAVFLSAYLWKDNYVRCHRRVSLRADINFGSSKQRGVLHGP
jgi:hypothetical protein